MVVRREAAPRRRHRHFLEADAEPGRRLGRQDAQMAAVDPPEHRADVDRCVLGIAAQPVPDDVEDLLRRLHWRQHQGPGRGDDALAMGHQVGGDSLDEARTVEHGRTQPSAVVGRPHDRHVIVMPRAVVICLDVGSGGHADPPPADCRRRLWRVQINWKSRRRSPSDSPSSRPLRGVALAATLRSSRDGGKGLRHGRRRTGMSGTLGAKYDTVGEAMPLALRLAHGELPSGSRFG